MANLFYCSVPVGQLRAEPAQKAEITSQLLFGETCEVQESKGEWHRVKCVYDGYEGYMTDSSLTELNSAPFSKPVRDWQAIYKHDGLMLHLPLGSLLPGVEETQVGPQAFEDIARMYLGTSYLWGGKSVFGADCSGFTQTVYRLCGVPLPRDARQQALDGETINLLQEARAGDLAFFDNDEGRIIHVGILLSPESIIHSSGNVHIDGIDTQGIVHYLSKKRTHKLRIIKRFF